VQSVLLLLVVVADCDPCCAVFVAAVDGVNKHDYYLNYNNNLSFTDVLIIFNN